MSENSPRPNARAQDQSAPRGAHGIQQQLFADSPVGNLSPFRLAKLRAQRLRFDDDFKSPSTEREKPKENVADASPFVPPEAKEYTCDDIPRLVQLLADKQKVIESTQAALTDMEQHLNRLRSLRRGVNSPAGLTESGRKERGRKPKDKLMDVEGEGTPRTPLAEMAVDSPMLPAAPSYINDLVSQIERLQIEKMELCRTTIPAAAPPKKSPSKGKRKIKVERERSEMESQVDAKERENEALEEQLMAQMKANAEMKEEICQLNLSLSNRGTDSEKRMEELEHEVEKLRAALDAATHSPFDKIVENVDVEELCSTNARLKERLDELTYSLTASERKTAIIEEHWMECVRKVTLENQELKQKLIVLDNRSSEIAELENEKILSLVERNKYEKLYSDTLARLEESIAMCETLSERNALLESKVKEFESQLWNRSRTAEHRVADDMRGGSQAQAPDCSSAAEQWLRPIARSCSLLREDKRAVQSMVGSLQRKVEEDVKEIMSKVNHVVQNLTHLNSDLVSKYQQEMALRKKLHNELVEIRGNIRVFCRIRPIIKEDRIEATKRSVVCCDQDDDSSVIVDHKDRKVKYDCDRVFDQSSTQQEVFDEVKALIVSCIDGFNVCIFAYGQTGSGKTYTMEGVADNPGLNQRALRQLFEEIEARRPDWTFNIFVSVLEIYNETLRDLLSDASSKVERLNVKMTAVGGLEVPGLTWAQVESVEDINEVSSVAHQNRTTAMTKMNERSSRSHALLCVNVEGTNNVTGAKTFGKLNLVDLAGSERVHKSGAEGNRLKEAQSINRSLSSLGDVIHALRNKQQHIPYRNSKLTYLLQNSLGGNSKTLMIVQVAPVDDHVSETIASLAFAQRIRSVEMGQATKRTAGRGATPKERPF